MIAIPTPGQADQRSGCAATMYRNYFAVGGINVEVSGESPQDVNLGPEMAPFICERSDCDIEVRIEWRPRLESSRAREIFHSGAVWSAHQCGEKFLFDFTIDRLGSRPYKRLVTDAAFEKAEVFLNHEFLSLHGIPSALEYPLDELLITHYLSLGHGIELHACGLINAGTESFLFAGHSGAGKSTTARLWTRHTGVEVLSDDRIIVRKKNGQFQMHGTPWHGEAAFAAPLQAPIQRVFLLEHGTGNGIERLSKSAAVGELLARSFVPFYQPRFVDPVLALLEDLVESVPCYRFHFVPDRSAVEKIHEFRD